MRKNISNEEVELSVRTQWKELGMNPYNQVTHFTNITSGWVDENKERKLFILNLFENLVRNTVFENKIEKNALLDDLKFTIQEYIV
jgi:hypothetical protein